MLRSLSVIDLVRCERETALLQILRLDVLRFDVPRGQSKAKLSVGHHRMLQSFREGDWDKAGIHLPRSTSASPPRA